jgi:hypothetical protein
MIAGIVYEKNKRLNGKETYVLTPLRLYFVYGSMRKRKRGRTGRRRLNALTLPMTIDLVWRVSCVLLVYVFEHHGKAPICTNAVCVGVADIAVCDLAHITPHHVCAQDVRAPHMTPSRPRSGRHCLPALSSAGRAVHGGSGGNGRGTPRALHCHDSPRSDTASLRAAAGKTLQPGIPIPFCRLR